MKILGPVSDILDAIPLSEIGTTARYVDHGADPNVARPSGTRPVIWRGSVEPVNMINGDEWEQEGVSYQPLDTDLTQLASLDSAVAGTLASDGAGWIKKTYTQLKTSLGLVKADVGLANVDNTSDAAKPVSTPQQAALDLKANLASPTFTGTVSGISKAMVGLSAVDNTSDAAKPVSTAQQTALNLKANLASPTFTGTVGGITKTMVGLGSVDNTADTVKPVSTAQQTALNLKADLASPTFTGTVGGISKAMVGLSAVDNTSDAAKPVSTAQQTALNAKADSSALVGKADLAGSTFAGTVNLDRHKLTNPNLGPYLENYNDLGAASGTVTLDLSIANHFAIVNPAATLALVFSNVPVVRAGNGMVSVTVLLQFSTLRAVTWPANTAWGGAGAPVLKVGQNWVTFWSPSTLTTWFAMLSWQT